MKEKEKMYRIQKMDIAFCGEGKSPVESATIARGVGELVFNVEGKIKEYRRQKESKKEYPWQGETKQDVVNRMATACQMLMSSVANGDPNTVAELAAELSLYAMIAADNTTYNTWSVQGYVICALMDDIVEYIKYDGGFYGVSNIEQAEQYTTLDHACYNAVKVAEAFKNVDVPYQVYVLDTFRNVKYLPSYPAPFQQWKG